MKELQSVEEELYVPPLASPDSNLWKDTVIAFVSDLLKLYTT